MTEERVETLFARALERSGDQREAYLEQACIGDGELRRELQSLLEKLREQNASLESKIQELLDRQGK